MLRDVIEQVLSYKVGVMTAGTSATLSVFTTLSWVGANLAQIGLALSAILTITLIVSHTCKTIRDNRTSRENSKQKEMEMELDLRDSEVLLRKSEVEIEELKLKVELLKLELMEKQEENNKE
jgi:hypothetical protein